jgi:oxygen-independent coproporphyrinogen-3 oxidase
VSIDTAPSAPDIDELAAALGPAARVAYAPPNIYPMSAPSFEPRRSRRPSRPIGDRLSVYVHIPFCNYHCNFCFYATQVGTPRDQMERYVAALLKELECLEAGTRLSQLYVGGGTPTALPPDLLDRVLTTLLERAQGADQPHTVECSPDSVTDEHIRVLRAHRIQRVSMGIQSMTEPVLENVRRNHRPAEAVDACARLVAGGLMVNIDLIYGLPGQSEADFERDFRTVVDQGVHTVTAYNLRVNERTPIAKLVEDDEKLHLARLVRWRAFVKAVAAQSGFVQTRWHTFRRSTGASPAQVLAERFEDLTGQGEQFSIGLSARSRLADVIYRNHSGFSTYIGRIERGESPVESIHPLSEQDLKTRFLALSIGDGSALDRKAYADRFGCSFDDDFGTPLDRLRGHGLVEDDGLVVALTKTGKLVYDLVLLAFYPSEVRSRIQQRQAAAPTP